MDTLMAERFLKGGQIGWFHDEGDSAGFFHTYDGLQVAGPNDTPRKVHVFLPRDYENSAARYPVLYMNDGDTSFFPGGPVGKSWHVANVLKKLYDSRSIRPLIVVAVCPLNRDREYTHEPVPDHDCCGLPGYADYLANHIKKFFDDNYRTASQPNQTTVLGSSHGGLAAFYTACCWPSRFGNSAAMSPSFWVGLESVGKFGTPLSQSSLIQATSPTLMSQGTRPKIWLDWGLIHTNGFHNEFIERFAAIRGREMEQLLRDEYGYVLGQNLFAMEDPDGDHSEESWSRRLPLVLRVFFRA
jgi:hypothetical protein